MTERAHLTAALVEAETTGSGVAPDLAEAVADCDARLVEAGVRGSVDPSPAARRARSTRRRQDAPDLPAKPSNGSTLGRTYTDAKSGRTFRPSMFLTVTLPSYGRVRSDDGTPVEAATYDYRRAARDALHFSKLLDRLVQNLRRVAGFDLQYFAAVEPQRRLAPHAHFAIRGTLPRADVRQVVEATYHQVWWPSTEHAVYDGTRHPVWDDHADGDAGGFVDPDSGIQLPTWDDALDDLGDEPNHVLRFGSQVDVVGVLAGTPEAERCIGYLVKYLTKSLGDSLDRAEEPAALTDRHEREPQPDHLAWHRDRLVEVLRTEPCSPTCPNWLRFGVQPKNARSGQRLGACRSKAHRPTHLGYAGCRVLASRKWTGKTLADHRADRRAFVLDVLGVRDDPATPVPSSLAWEVAKRSDPDVPPLSRRLLLAIAQRQRWRMEYDRARELHACGPPAAPASKTKNPTGDAA